MKRNVMPEESGDSAWFSRFNAFEQQETRRQVEYKRRRWPELGDGVWSKNPDISYPHILPAGNLENAFYHPIARLTLDYCYRYDIQLHSEALNLKSSQVCCFNFLFPLRQDPDLAVEVLGSLLPGVDKITAIEFEYTGPEEATQWLGEPKDGGRGRNRTSIDAAIWWESKGTRHLTLVEWKYTESGYGACGGYHSKWNKAPQRCDELDPLDQGAAQSCYLTQGRNNRRYWERLREAGIDLTVLADMGGCPFKGPFYQLLRQHLLAAYLRTTDKDLIVDVAAVNFRGNESVKAVDREIGKIAGTVSEAWNRALCGVPEFRCVEAEAITSCLRASKQGGAVSLATYLKERYGV